MKAAVTASPRERRRELGQFFTASPVADFMASMFGSLPRTVRLLDAGAGAGALTSAFVTRCCEKRDGVSAFVSHIAWESEVWIADDPDHMIHFNGERFMGPYPDVMPTSR